MMVFQRWRERLQQAGLTPLADLCLQIAEPLSPIGAQLLWIAQPTLGLVMDRDKVAAWAQELEDPQTIARIRATLKDDAHD